jgi:DnaJ-domain-containing protein 1
MDIPEISNRPGPNCELTVRVKFPTLERFRSDYREQIVEGRYFVKSSRTKPIGTRIQIIFVIEELAAQEIWSWGIVNEEITPAIAAEQDRRSGIGLQLMDINPQRSSQIEQLFGVDDFVSEIKKRRISEAQGTTKVPDYVKVQRTARHELTERAQELIELVKNGDYYAILGLVKNASTDDIRTAYHQKTKRFHPDQFYRHISEDLHAELDKAFQKVTSAYHTLRDEKLRADYDTSIGNYLNPVAQRAAMSHVRLQQQFRKNYDQIISPRLPQVKGLLEASEQDILVGSFRAAFSKLKLANAMDPLNPTIKTKLKEVSERLALMGEE